MCQGEITAIELQLLETIATAKTKPGLSYHQVTWQYGEELRISFIVSGPYSIELFGAMTGIEYSNIETFVSEVNAQHSVFGPEFLTRAADVLAVGHADETCRCLRAPGMNAINVGNYFYALCTPSAELVVAGESIWVATDPEPSAPES